MSKLTVIDRQEYILQGEFERIKAPERTILDENNVILAVQKFKEEVVDLGLGLGTLNDGFLTIPTEYGDQVYEEDKEPAFMILSVYWDSDKGAICGTIIILDNDEGNKVKAAIDQGVECFMSASETDSYEDMDKESGRILYKICDIKGYKLSLFNFKSTVNL